MMTKTAFERRLSDYVRGELPADEAREMEAYLRGHPEAAELEKSFREVLTLAEQIREEQPPEGLLEEARAGLLEQIETRKQPVTQRRGALLLKRFHLPRLLRPAYVLGMAAVIAVAAIGLLWRDATHLAWAEVMEEIMHLRSFRVEGWIRGEDGARKPYRQWLQSPSFFRAEVGEGKQQRVVISDGTWRLIEAQDGTIYRERVPESEVRSIEAAASLLYVDEEKEFEEASLQVSQEDLGQAVRFTIWGSASRPGRGPADLKVQVEVNRSTRLPVRVVVYQKSENDWHAVSDLYYADYNVPFPREMFRMASSEGALPIPEGEQKDLWFERSITPKFALFPATDVPLGGVEITLLDPPKGSSGESTYTMGGVVKSEFRQYPLPEIIRSLTGMAVETEDETIRQQRVSMKVSYKKVLPWRNRIEALCRMFGVRAELTQRQATGTRFVFTQNGSDFPLTQRRWGGSDLTVNGSKVGGYRYTYERADLESVIRNLFTSSHGTGFNRDTDTLEFRWEDDPEQNPFNRKVDVEFASSGEWTENLRHLRETFGVQMEQVPEPVTYPLLILRPNVELETGRTPDTSRQVGGEVLESFPNPGNPEVAIPFVLYREADVRVRIFNVQGQVVRTLNVGRKAASRYAGPSQAARWDARDDRGQPVASGTYLYRLELDGRPTRARKLSIVR